MSSCKDCIHSKVCQFFDYRISSNAEQKCKYFKDCSRFMELPKIGNYVYRVYPLDCMGNYGISKMKVEGICISTNRAVFDMKLIGKIIFFTGKEAEQALEERKQRNNTD